MWCLIFRRPAQSKQTASKENESTEEMDAFQSSSPVQDIAQEVAMEEEDVSNVRVSVCVLHTFGLCYPQIFDLWIPAPAGPQTRGAG